MTPFPTSVSPAVAPQTPGFHDGAQQNRLQVSHF